MQCKRRKKYKVQKLMQIKLSKDIKVHGVCIYVSRNNNQCKQIVSTDEAMFYLGSSYVRRRVCYYRKGVDDVSKLKICKT